VVDVTRRRLIQGTAAAAALPVVTALPGAAAVPARLVDIDHIIILMKENRSFDHYFGALGGVRGFGDPKALRQANGRSVFEQPDPVEPGRVILPFRLDTARTNAQRIRDLDHEWIAQHASWNRGAMDGWIAAHRAANGERAPMTMGYFTRTDLPFYYALADAFTICDGYHCSMFGPTHPNRFYLWTGTIDPAGKGGGPALDNDSKRYSWETYPERLERAGVTWRIYHENPRTSLNAVQYFAPFQDAVPGSALYENAMRPTPFAALLGDLRSGNIPQVTWIVPAVQASEHPAFMPAAGEDYTRQILEALWSNPALWARSVFIQNYDENDGQFDHVPPPVPPQDTDGEYIGDEPIGLGFRVPCLVVSPLARGGYVCGDVFDHTSTLRLIEARFGVEVPNLTAWRRGVSGDLTRALRLGHAPRFDVPKLPDTAAALDRATRNAASLPPPEAPASPRMPRQEAGLRRIRV